MHCTAFTGCMLLAERLLSHNLQASCPGDMSKPCLKGGGTEPVGEQQTFGKGCSAICVTQLRIAAQCSGTRCVGEQVLAILQAWAETVPVASQDAARSGSCSLVYGIAI